MIKQAAAMTVPLLMPGKLTSIPFMPHPANLSSTKFGDERDWFLESRYGLFVHWGLYSIPAWHEQHQWRMKVPRAEYVKLASKWNPKRFDPEEWLDLMEIAGMKYITFTTKHHDGFCLWETKQTKFNTINTPYKKDILGMLSDACHKRKIPLCLYYSIADWNHPAYPNQGRHHELAGPEPGDKPDWGAYMEFLKAQVNELCSDYGKIHGFWWDMNVPKYNDPSINEMIRKLQPAAVINNRGFDEGDFGTPERDLQNATDGPDSRPVEACQSVGIESWGFRKDEDYYTDLHLQKSIDRYLSMGANYLLNAGPTAEGVIPDVSQAMLMRIGEWFASVEESYMNTESAPGLLSGNDVLVTRRDNVIYLHFNKGLTGNGIKLKPLESLPVSAKLLNTGKSVEFSADLLPSEHLSQKKYLRLKNLPANDMSGQVPVIKLVFRTDPSGKA